MAIAELVSAIERAPDEIDAYLVLADALTQAGDPRGELIAVQHALATRTGGERGVLEARMHELIGARHHALLGDLAIADRVELQYRLGFLDELAVRGPFSVTDACVALARVFASPEATLLRGLVLDPGVRGVTDHVLRLICDGLRGAAIPPRLRRLALGSTYHGKMGYRMYSGDVHAFEDDLSELLAVVPQLAELRIDLGAVALTWQGPLVSEHLERFAYVSPYVRHEELPALAGSRLPALESFVLWTGAHVLVDEEMDIFAPMDGQVLELAELHAEPLAEPLAHQVAIGADDLGGLITMLEGCPRLRELGICNFVFPIFELVELLVRSPLLARLERLELACCALDESIDLLLEAAPRLRRLGVANAVIDHALHDRLVARPGLELAGTPRRDGPYPYVYVATQE